MHRKTLKRVFSAALSLAMALSCLAGLASAASYEEVLVTDGTELNAALSSLADEGTLIITLANDIDAVTSATYAAYKTGASVTINGNGHTINGNEVNDTALRFGARQSQQLNLTVNDTVFANLRNDDRQGGGAIGLWNGALSISGSTFTNNAATGGAGGAIRHQAGAASSISGSTFTGNSSNGAGGALNIAVAGATIDGVTVENNSAGAPGGGIAVPNGRNGAAPAAVTLTNSRVVNNLPDNTLNVIDGGNNVLVLLNALDLTRSDASSDTSAVFDLVANFAAVNVNLVEAVINYDATKYDVAALTSVDDTEVKIVDVDTDAGRVRVVLGVTGTTAALGNEESVVLATLTVAPKAGETPAYAYVELSSYAAYSVGEAVDIVVGSSDAASEFNYQAPPTIPDVNKDGEVTAADLSLALYYFGSENPDADFNEDGVVDILDITILVNLLYA